jgi:hypothetical protein
MQPKTTEDLRRILFDTLDKVQKKQIDLGEASAIVNLSKAIVQTADLELKAAITLSRIDEANTGVSPGPLLLLSQADRSVKAVA